MHPINAHILNSISLYQKLPSAISIAYIIFNLLSKLIELLLVIFVVTKLHRILIKIKFYMYENVLFNGLTLSILKNKQKISCS